MINYIATRMIKIITDHISQSASYLDKKDKMIQYILKQNYVENTNRYFYQKLNFLLYNSFNQG